MPPNEKCPNCLEMIEDWHVEWYETEQSALYQGLAAMDCPLCGQSVGFHKGTVGPAAAGVPLVKRHAHKAAEWATLGAAYGGGTLSGYLSNAGPGAQYANYWPILEVHLADQDEKAKNQGP